MGPYSGVDYNLTLCQSIDLLNSMPESILSPSQGLRIWPQGYIQTYAQGSIQSYSTVRTYTAQCKLMCMIP